MNSYLFSGFSSSYDVESLVSGSQAWKSAELESSIAQSSVTSSRSPGASCNKYL